MSSVSNAPPRISAADSGQLATNPRVARLRRQWALFTRNKGAVIGLIDADGARGVATQGRRLMESVRYEEAATAQSCTLAEDDAHGEHVVHRPSPLQLQQARGRLVELRLSRTEKSVCRADGPTRSGGGREMNDEGAWWRARWCVRPPCGGVSWRGGRRRCSQSCSESTA